MLRAAMRRSYFFKIYNEMRHLELLTAKVVKEADSRTISKLSKQSSIQLDEKEDALSNLMQLAPEPSRYIRSIHVSNGTLQDEITDE